MCRMLGVIGQNQVPAREWLDAFYPLCTQGRVKSTAKPGHLDGWGIAGYPHGQAVYYARRPLDASQDKEAWQNAVQQVDKHQSGTLIAHFRKASTGGNVRENTHPFRKNGWFFCHNGTVYQAEKLPLKKYTPEGQTDSERFFLFVLEAIERIGDPARGLMEAIRSIRESCEYNSLTFILTDGKTLYTHRSFTDQRLETGETREEREGYYTLWTWQSGGNQGVCSEPIPGEKTSGWEKLSNGALWVLSAAKPTQKEQIL